MSNGKESLGLDSFITNKFQFVDKLHLYKSKKVINSSVKAHSTVKKLVKKMIFFLSKRSIFSSILAHNGCLALGPSFQRPC